MAITVTNNNTRRDSYDGTYGGSNIGSGSPGGDAVDSYYQLASGAIGAWGRKIGTTGVERGFETTITSINMTTSGNEVFLAKGLILNNPALNAPGIRIRLGSSSSNYYAVIIGDDGTRGDVTYPAKGGWVIRPIDPNLTAWRDEVGGSGATLTAIVNVSVTGNVSTVAKEYI
jgi:hypothetical protein